MNRLDDFDGSVSHLELVELSAPSIGLLGQHFVRSGCLVEWCSYVIDSAVQQAFAWSEPDRQHFLWWYNFESELEVSNWLDKICNKTSLNWHLSVSSAYYSAANKWYSSHLEDLYVNRRHAYESAHCNLIDCMGNQGLAVEISNLLDSSDIEPAEMLQSVGDRAKLSSLSVSLSDISSGIPQILAGCPPGEWLPPFQYGNSWILLQLVRHERPTRQEMAPQLLREAIQSWRQQRCHQLVDHWLQALNISQAAADV